MSLLAVDPGVRGCGISRWEDGKLKHADYISITSTKTGPAVWHEASFRIRWFKFDELVIEMPQVYVRSRSKGDPNDLIAVAAVVGAIGSGGGAVFTYKPSEWKGQVPKKIHHERIKKLLSKEELASIKFPSKSLEHNVWDAIGLGLFHLKRRKA